ncbi:PaaI family thioesterase [Rhodobaculum claviforme]|uniref:Thioesterase n=1 Tax=Rhodobaculum claviforme TaxID=1549854 RepID=A0A934WJ08_9RHOB|nr:PaaI family thioesterase [Rhodobaculum claviforme]MBK5927359.1 thioesterase [Rhodobaculum claviforme]
MTDPAPRLTPAQITAMHGLDYLRGLVAGRFAMPTLAEAIGYTLVRADPGEVAIRATAGPSHLNPMGGVHGGWYGAILDSALGCAVMTAVPAGRWYTTLEYKVNLTRALPLGTEVEATATLRHAGRTTGVADAVLRGVACGRVYATGSTTCLIMDA